MTRPLDPRLVEAFYEAALWLKAEIEARRLRFFSTNFLREYARCKGFSFSNTLSPVIYDEVKRRHPELARWIVTNEHANARSEDEPSLL
ncbi:MAG: hypothetical protein ABWZ01_07200 [Methyloceanibacter sp.]